MEVISIEDIKDQHILDLVEVLTKISDVDLTINKDGTTLVLCGDFATFMLIVRDYDDLENMKIGIMPSLVSDPAYVVSVVIGLYHYGYKVEMAGAYVEDVNDGSIIVCLDKDSSNNAYQMKDQHRLIEAEKIYGELNPVDNNPKLIVPDNKIIH